MRLIDANALKKQYIETDKWGKVILILDVVNAPTIDAEQVVRCKDCKNAGRKMGTHYHCEQQMSWHEEEYFCSYGERREP